MLSIVKSMSLHGLSGSLLSVETDISRRSSNMGNCTDFLIQVLKNQEKE